MTQLIIEIEQGGAGTIAIDGAEPVPFQNAEEVCSVIESLAGQPDADEASAFGAATEGMEPPQRMAPAKPQMGQRGM
jgi:hypothetical protein